MNISARRLFLAAALLLGAGGRASAVVKTWNAVSPGNASGSGNWSPVGVPTNGDSIVFDGTSIQDCTWDLTGGPSFVGFSLKPAYTGFVTASAGTGFTVNTSGGGGLAVEGGYLTINNPAGVFDWDAVTVRGGGVFEVFAGTVSFSAAGSSITVAGGSFALGNNGAVAVDTITVTNAGNFQMSGGGFEPRLSSGSSVNMLSVVIEDGQLDLTAGVIKSLGPRGLDIRPLAVLTAISSVTFAGPLLPGATAINFPLGGFFTSTFTNVAFSRSDVNVAAVGGFSGSLTMRKPRGPFGTPQFESDPGNVVAWPDNPTASIAAPAGASASNLTVISGAAASNGIDTISNIEIKIKRVADGFYWDGASFNASPTNLAPSFTPGLTNPAWSRTDSPLQSAVVNGQTYRIIVNAIDSNGTRSADAVRTVTMDLNPPFVDILSFNNNDVHQGFPAVSGTASDGASGLSSIQVTITSGPYYTTYWNGAAWQATGSTFTFFSAPWNAAGLPNPANLVPGTTYQVQAAAFDNAGNQALVVDRFLFTARGMKIWTGAAFGSASAGSNWVGGFPPFDGDYVVFGSTNPGNACTWDLDISLSSMNVTALYQANVMVYSTITVLGPFDVDGLSNGSIAFNAGPDRVSFLGTPVNLTNNAVLTVINSTLTAMGGITATTNATLVLNSGWIRTPNLNLGGGGLSLFENFGSSSVVTSTGPAAEVDVVVGGIFTADGASFRKLKPSGLRFTTGVTFSGVTSVSFEDLHPQTTAIAFNSGYTGSATTWDNVIFADPNIVTNIYAQTPVSFGITVNASGPRAGPQFEYDPTSMIHWPGYPPGPPTRVVGASLAPAFLGTNASDAPMLRLELWNDWGSKSLSALKVNLLGDLPAGQVRARVWQDTDANGTLQTGSDLFLSEAYFTAGAPSQANVVLTTPPTLDASTRTFFVALSYANVPGGKTVELAVGPGEIDTGPEVLPFQPVKTPRIPVRVTVPASPFGNYPTPTAGTTNSGGFDTQLFVNKGQQFAVQAFGTWFDGTSNVGPAGSATSGGLGAGLFIGQLVGRVGGGAWFALNATSTLTATQSGNLALAMSATNYAAVAGALDVQYAILPSTTPKVWVGGASGFPFAASVDSNWSPASRPAAGEQVIFDASGFDCDWDIPGLFISSLTMTANYFKVLRVVPANGVRNSLQIGTHTFLRQGTLDVGGNDLIVHGELVVRDNADLDLPPGSVVRMANLFVKAGGTLRSRGTGAMPVTLGQPFGPPNWSLNVEDGILDVDPSGGFFVDARKILLSSNPAVTRFDNVRRFGQSGEAALTLNLLSGPIWTLRNWTFEGNPSYNVHAPTSTSPGLSVTFENATGSRMGSTFELDPNGYIHWSPDGGGSPGTIQGTLSYSGGQPGPYIVLASTSPGGVVTSQGMTLSTNTGSFTLSGLPTPATYFLFAFPSSYGTPPSPGAPRGGYQVPGAYRSAPILLTPGGWLTGNDIAMEDVADLTGSWTGDYTQVGPLRVQAWRGGDPSLVPTASLEADAVVTPPNYTLYLQDATNYFIVGFVDVDNDRYPDNFEAKGSSSPVLMASASHPGVNLFVTGGSAAPGGFVSVATNTANAGYVRSNGWDSLLRVSLGATSSSASLNAISLNYSGAQQPTGVSLAIVEDVDGDGTMKLGQPDQMVASGFLPPGVVGSTLPFFTPHRLDAIPPGTTRHYFVAVELGGQRAGPFEVFIASPASFGLGAGSIGFQPIYPITSGLVTPRLFVPAGTPANADGSGGFSTNDVVFPGQTLVVSATGTWKRFGGDAGVGPDGQPGTSGLNTVLPSANHGALLARIQRFDSQPEPWFKVGASSTIVREKGGWLYFAMNDFVGAYYDNMDGLGVAYQVSGSTTGKFVGTVYYTGAESGDIEILAQSGPESASTRVTLAGGTTYYPYVLDRMQTSGGWELTATVLNNPIQSARRNAPLSAGATVQVDFDIPLGTGTITGNISYSGVMPFGDFIIVVATVTNWQNDVEIVGLSSQAAAGAFTLNNLALPATYYVVGFRSATGGDGGPKGAEPFGYYGAPGASLSQFGTALAPVYLSTASYGGVNFSVFDTGEIRGRVGLPPTPGGANLIVLAGRGRIGSAGFAFENESRRFHQSAVPSQVDYAIELLRPATDYSVFAWLDSNFDDQAGAGEPTFFSQPNVSVPQGGARNLDFALLAPAAPPAPTSFRAAASNVNVTFAWDAVLGASQYELRNATSGVVAFLAASATEYIDALPSNTSSQILAITATNANGTSPSATIAPVYTLAAFPNTPTPDAIGQTSAQFSWVPNNPAGTLFDVDRSTFPVYFARVAQTTSTTHSDAGLAGGATYYYRVRALNGNGVPSPYSGALTVVTSPASGPAILGSVSYSGAQKGFLRVEASTSTGFFPISSSVSLPPSPQQPYQLTVGAGQTYFVRGYVDVDGDNGLDPFEDRGPASALSVPVGATPVAGQDFSIVVDTVAPAAPAGVTAAPGFKQVRLAWNAPTRNADNSPIADLLGFVVERAASAGGPFGAITPIISTTVFVDTTAVVAVPQYYRVYAKDLGLNTSAPSGLISGTASPGGSISGQLATFVGGGTSGVFYVRLSTLPFPGAPAVAESTLPNFTFGGLADGVYYLTGFQDRDNDRAQNPLSEPAGTHGGLTRPYPLRIAGGNAITGADVTICERTMLLATTPAAGSLTGVDCPARDKGAGHETDLYAFVVGGGAVGSLAPGSEVNLKLSAAYDTELILLGPDGGVLARDNRPGGAGLRLALTQPGVYVVEPTQFSAADSGPYTLTMSVTGGFGGSIGGTVLYSGARPGSIQVQLYVSPDTAAAPIRISSMAAPGGFSFAGLPDGLYYLRAFRDANGNGARDPGEPTGAFGQETTPTQIQIIGGVATTGVVEILITDPAAGAVTGVLVYDGSQAGPLRVEIGPRGCTDCTSPLQSVVAFASTQAFNAYELTFIPPATNYYLQAYVDSNGNRFADTLEAKASSSPVSVVANSTTTVSLVVRDPGFGAAGNATIVGSVTYNGSQNGAIYLAFTKDQTFTTIDYILVLSTAGNFVKSGLAGEATYYFGGFQDVNGNGNHDEDQGEPAAHGGPEGVALEGAPPPIYLTASGLATAYMTLEAPPTGELRGRLAYSGSAPLSQPLVVLAYRADGASGAGAARRATVSRLGGGSYFDYSLPYLQASSSYSVIAWIDATPNFEVDPGEPIGYFQGPNCSGSQCVSAPVKVSSGTDALPTYGVNVEVRDPGVGGGFGTTDGGRIQGEVIYLGVQSGPFYVRVFDNGDFAGQPLYVQSVAAPAGPASVDFEFAGVPSGSYWIEAFRDATGTGQFNPLFQGRTWAQATVVTGDHGGHLDMPALIDPGGAGSLNVFTGDFASAAGARFDGGSSDMAFYIAADTVTAGGPFIYVSGFTTQVDGARLHLVKYSSSGAVLESALLDNDGTVPRLLVDDGYLYVFGATRPEFSTQYPVIEVRDASDLSLIYENRLLDGEAVQDGAVYQGTAYVGMQDTQPGQPDLVRAVDPVTGVTLATGTFNFPGSFGSPHADSLAVDPADGDVYVLMTTGGGGYGDLAGLLKFNAALDGPSAGPGDPLIVKDVTGFEPKNGELAVSPVSGDVYLAVIDAQNAVARVRRFDSNLNLLGQASTPIHVSALVNMPFLAVGDDGTVYLGVTGPGNGGDLKVVRYSPALAELASRSFDGFNGTLGDFGTGVAVKDSTNVFIAGAVNNGVNFDWITMRMDLNASGSASAAGQTVVITTATATQAIYGTLQYAGTEVAGTFRALLLPYDGTVPVRVSTASFSGARGYLFNNVPPGYYVIRAMLDLNGNFAADAGEPIGWSTVNGLEFDGTTIPDFDVELCDRRQVSSGVDVFDALTQTDCRSSDIFSRQKLYTFQGRRGQVVSVGVEALGFVDSYVVLYGPKGEYVAEDDDSWGDGDALIYNLTLPEDGLYTIAASAYDEEALGSYRLVFDGSAGSPGSISGVVDYTGSQGGQVFVGLFRSPSFSTSTAAGAQVLTSTRAFAFTNLPSGTTYYIGAFIDVNFNKIPDPGEDSGVFGEAGAPAPILLESGQDVQVRVLVEPSTSAAPSGYVTGSVAYSGLRTGPVRLEFWSSASFLGRPAAVRELPAPGAYDVSVPGGVTYYVKAFLDADVDFFPDPDEPRGVYAPGDQGAQAVFVPVANSISGVDLTLRDPGATAGGGLAGEGAATIFPSTAVAGYQTFNATIEFTVGANGIDTGGSIGFGVPPGFLFPQGVTIVSTRSADLSAVSYQGPSAFVTVTGPALLAGQRVSFAYTSPFAPCEVSTRAFVVSSAKEASTPRQPLIAGSPAVYTRPGGPAFFQPAQGYLALESGKRSEPQSLEARDLCGNRAPVAGSTTVALRGKSFNGSGFGDDPTLGLSTGATLSTTSAISLLFAAGESAKTFYALATSTGWKNIEVFYTLGSEATSYIGVNVLPAGAISQVGVSTSPSGVSASSTTITPNNDGLADQAFIRFTLADNFLPWHVLLSSTPFKQGVNPIWETWGFGQPAPGSIAWDGRYSPWINQGARVPNGLYFVRIEAGGAGVFNDELSIGVSVAQFAGRVFDGGQTPNPPLEAARLQIFGPSGYATAASDASGAFVAPGVAAGVYNVSVAREDFLPGSLRVTLSASGGVSTFTATTAGISGAINASGGLDIVMNRAPALVVVPPSAVAVATSAFDRWGFMQVRSSTSAATPIQLFSPLRLAAGTTTFDDGGQWDPGTQQFVTRTTMKFNVPQGSYAVEARLEGFAPSTAAVVVGASGATVVLPALTAKASIAGTVSVAANPDGMHVSVDAVPLSTTTAIAGNSGHVFLPAGQTSGAFLIGGLDAGVYVVRASAFGLVTNSSGPIAVAANAQVTGVVVPTLTAGAQITGNVTILGTTTGGNLYVNAWAPGTLSFGSTFLYILPGTNVVSPYAISGLNAGTQYLLYANFETGGRYTSLQPLPVAVAGGGTQNFTFGPSSGVLSGTFVLPAGNTDFINVSIAGTVIAASRPEDVGGSFQQDGAHTLDNFLCVPDGVPAPTGYCPATSSTGTFKLYNQQTETVDLVFTYRTTGQTQRKRLSMVNGSTTTLFVDLTGETWSVSGEIVNQVSHPLFNTNPRIVQNAQFSAPPGYPVGISSSAARVVAVRQDPEKFTVALSTSFDPLTSRVGFLAQSGTFTISNVPSGVYYVRTSGLAACATCEIVVPSVGRIVRVSTNVAGVSLTVSDGFSVSGSFSLGGGLQDSGDFVVSVVNRRQEVVRSTTVALGNSALGQTANSASFSFSNLPAGEFYTLSVRGAGEAPRYAGRPLRFPDSALSPTGLQSNLTGQNLTLSRAAYVIGRLRDGGTGALIGAGNAGLLAPTFAISATANPWVEGGYTLAGSSIAGRPILGDGTFRVGPLLPDVSYDVRFAQTGWDANFLQRGSQNFTPKTISGVRPQEGETRDLGVVSLHQGHSISGVVRQSTTTGQVLGGLTILARPTFGSSEQVEAQAFTDAQGRYSIWVSSYISTQYDVTAAPRGGNVASNGLTYGEVTVRAVNLQLRTTVDFFLEPLLGEVTGQVVVEDAATGGELSYPFGELRGFPAAALNLQLVGTVPTKNPLGDIEERTDATGRFSIRGLPSGTYSMRVTSLGYSVFTATVTKTAAGFQLYTGTNTPSNYLPANTVTLRRGATVTGRILKSDGSTPSTEEVASVAAANFAAGEFVVGSVDIDQVAKTVNSYSISGFKPNVAYDLVIVPSGRGGDVSFPPEGRGVLFTTAESTGVKSINLTFTPTGIDCSATSKSLGNNQFQVKIDCTKALRNTLPSDDDLDLLLALSTYTSAGAAVASPNNTGQLLGADKKLSSDRRQLTAIYRAGAAETQFHLRLRAAAAAVDPTTGSNFAIDEVFDFYTGLESNVVERIANMNGGSIQLEPSGEDLQLGLDERGRVDLRPGTFADDNDVIVASATIPVGLTKARDRQSASVLYVQRYGFAPASLQSPIRAASLPDELYSAMSTYRTQASTTQVGGANPLSSFYNIFLPAGIRHQLKQRADLTFSYDTSVSTLAANDPDRINVWFYNAVLGRYVLESTDRRVDTVNKTITVSVDHFSVFVVLDSTPTIQAPNVRQTDEIQAVNFPNPADCITHSNIARNSALFGSGGVVPPFEGTMIRYSLPPGAATEAKIRIYNVAGERVRTIEPGTLQGGFTYYSPWDCRNEDRGTVSSGVYIGEVSWNGQSKFFKIAIIKGSGL